MKIQIIKAMGCPSCAEVRKLIERIVKEENLKCTIEEIDILDHPELVQKYKIMTSPAIIIDGKLVLSGKPSLDELRAVLL